MTKHESEFLILKLRSGDEIIGKKVGGSKNTLILNRPLQLQRSTLLDPMTGEVRKNICVFRDWLEFTTVLDSEIPTDHIVMSAPPSPDLLKRYLQELNNLDNPKPKKVAKPPQKSDQREDILDSFFKELNKQEKPQSPSLDSILSKLGSPPSVNPAMVTATFHMPPEVFMNIILNMPLFEMGDIMDGDDGENGGDIDFGDDDGEDEPKNPPQQPNNNQKKKKPKGNSGDEPPQGWQGRFGFPK